MWLNGRKFPKGESMEEARRKVYLDNSATTQMSMEVFDEMLPYLQLKYHNASARYSDALHIKTAIQMARQKVAALINADPDEIFFTSGGTESNNWAVKIGYGKDIRGGMITSMIEHPSVYNAVREMKPPDKERIGPIFVRTDRYGFINPNQIRSIADWYEMRGSGVGLVSIMMANNEVGTIQPIKEIATLVHEYAGYLHTDAVQAVGNIDIDVKEMGIDLLSMSSHKLYGPKGIGALYIERTVPKVPLLFGGGQESGMRSGTENTAMIVGFGKACELAKNNLEKHIKTLQRLRDRFVALLYESIPDIFIIGTDIRSKRLPGNIAIAFEGVEAESLLMMLDGYGICCSVGSACSSNKLEPSRVLKAMNVPDELLHCVVRFSFGDQNTNEDVEYAVEKIRQCVELLRGM